MSEVSLQHIEKVYPHSEKKKSNLKVTDEGVLAVQDFNLNISDREFIVLVGALRLRKIYHAEDGGRVGGDHQG